MMDWFRTLIDILFIWCPRRIQIKTTHGAVKYVRDDAVELKPGCHWYWPWTSSYIEFPTALQTHNLPTQSVLISHGVDDQADVVPVAVSGVIVYRVVDILAALSHSFEVEDTINDVGLAAIMEVLVGQEQHDLMMRLKDGRLTGELTEMTGKRLAQYGIDVVRCSLTDFTTCTPILSLGEGGVAAPVPFEHHS